MSKAALGDAFQGGEGHQGQEQAQADAGQGEQQRVPVQVEPEPAPPGELADVVGFLHPEAFYLLAAHEGQVAANAVHPGAVIEGDADQAQGLGLGGVEHDDAAAGLEGGFQPGDAGQGAIAGEDGVAGHGQGPVFLPAEPVIQGVLDLGQGGEAALALLQQGGHVQAPGLQQGVLLAAMDDQQVAVCCFF